MRIKKYKNLKEALESLIRKDKEYVFVRHRLKSGEKIKSHYHKKANEFIVIDNGKFRVRLAEKEKLFNLKNQVVTIFFPKKQKHSLSALTPTSYFVFRDT